MSIEFDPTLFEFGGGDCRGGQASEFVGLISTEKLNEYNILNVPFTQIWQATWNSGVTFNVTLIAGVGDAGPGFVIDFLGQCIAIDRLTRPVILTTTVF